jgi:plasmid stabilization system protein ParE
VIAARAWYEEQRATLGDEFAAALERVLDLITRMPNACPEIAPRTRRALLRRFPYALYYRVESDSLDVVACLHTSRSPEELSGRG